MKRYSSNYFSFNALKTAAELNAVSPSFNWERYLIGMTEASDADPWLTDAAKVKVDYHPFFSGLQTVITNRSKKALQVYLLLAYVHEHLKYIDLDSVPVIKTLYKDNPLYSTDPCFYSTFETFQIFYVRKILRAFATEEQKEKATEITAFIQNEFMRTVNQSTWMDSTTKAKTWEKYSKMKTFVGTPTYINNMTYIKYYMGDYVNSPTDWFGNNVNANNQKSSYLLSHYR